MGDSEQSNVTREWNELQEDLGSEMQEILSYRKLERL